MLRKFYNFCGHLLTFFSASKVNYFDFGCTYNRHLNGKTSGVWSIQSPLEPNRKQIIASFDHPAVAGFGMPHPFGHGQDQPDCLRIKVRIYGNFHFGICNGTVHLHDHFQQYATTIFVTITCRRIAQIFLDENFQGIHAAWKFGGAEPIHTQALLFASVCLNLGIGLSEAASGKQAGNQEQDKCNFVFHGFGCLPLLLLTPLFEVDEMLVAVRACQIAAVAAQFVEDAGAGGGGLRGIRVVAGAELRMLQLEVLRVEQVAGDEADAAHLIDGVARSVAGR